MSHAELTDISIQALKKKGLTGWGITICDECELAFIDGIEGNVEDQLCDACWDKKESN